MEMEVSLISVHPVVRRFVLNIVRTIREKKFGGEKFVIDAEMVPKVSGDVMMASMGRGIVRPMDEEVKTPEIIRKDMSELIAPIERLPSRRAVRPRQAVSVRPAIMSPAKVNTVAPAISRPVTPSKPTGVVAEGYGKIIPLLNDASISTIECLGKGKELMIVRAGQRQRTRIVLEDKEIMNILEKVADEAHIPLIGGIFRASISKFSINAVVSKIIGSKFVIKKATAYNLIN